MYLKGTFEKDDQVMFFKRIISSGHSLNHSQNPQFFQANAAYAKMGKADKKTSDMAFDTLFGGSSEKMNEN